MMVRQYIKLQDKPNAIRSTTAKQIDKTWSLGHVMVVYARRKRKSAWKLGLSADVTSWARSTGGRRTLPL